MKYLIAGTGGTGAAIGSFLQKGGKDVTFVARGENLRVIREKGIMVKSDLKGLFHLNPVRVKAQEELGRCDNDETYDVIFLCTKSYSVNEILPHLRRVCKEDTIVIPIINVYGTGERVQEELEGVTVLDGCMYIVAYRDAPGSFVQSGNIFRVVFGEREADRQNAEKLQQIEKDLNDSGIRGYLSSQIKTDTYRKYCCICSFASCGAYFNVTAGAMHKEGRERELLKGLLIEMAAIADAMGLAADCDLVAENLRVVDHMLPDATASTQKDIAAGRPTEMDGLTFEVLRLAKKYGVEAPNYEKVCAHFGFTL